MVVQMASFTHKVYSQSSAELYNISNKTGPKIEIYGTAFISVVMLSTNFAFSPFMPDFYLIF